MAERAALVTGATRGMGRAIALCLAHAGHRVVATGRDEDLLAELPAEGGVEPLPGDIATPDGCERVVEDARRRAGPITILVNNAGRGGHHDLPIWEQDRAGWDATMAVNLDAPFELTRLIAPDVVAAGWGRVVMISSTAGQLGAPSMSPYCASKHGVIGLMRSVAQDLAPHGGTCNAILPGWVRTEMAERDAEREAAERGMSVEEVWAERDADNPAGRIVTPEEIADVTAYLCSDASAAVNGEAITVSLGAPW